MLLELRCKRLAITAYDRLCSCISVPDTCSRLQVSLTSNYNCIRIQVDTTCIWATLSILTRCLLVRLICLRTVLFIDAYLVLFSFFSISFILCAVFRDMFLLLLYTVCVCRAVLNHTVLYFTYFRRPCSDPAPL